MDLLGLFELLAWRQVRGGEDLEDLGGGLLGGSRELGNAGLRVLRVVLQLFNFS